MSTQIKVLSLTALILVLAGSIAGIMYFKGRIEARNKEIAKMSEQAPIDESLTEKSSTSTEIWSNVAVGQKMGNPFVFEMRSPFQAATWMLQDNAGKVLASGFVSSNQETAVVNGWYDEVPKSKTGWFAIADALSSAMPQYRIPVQLTTQTETVEAYFPNPKKSGKASCDQVFPVKRTVVTSGGNVMDHYAAALRALTKGPTQEESAKGFTTAFPEEAKFIRVGQDESGRLVGDFPKSLVDGIQDRCRLSLIRSQIEETLKTVPLQGRALEGRVYLDGTEATF